jgi:hypothetical protein
LRQKFSSILVVALLTIFAGCQENSRTSKTQITHSEDVAKVFIQTTEIPSGITTPNNVPTSIGELKYLDGAPLPETAELVYENLDRMRGVDVFLKCMPAASVRQLMLGPKELGADAYNKVMITEDLMDSKPLFLTANTSTLYVAPSLNLKDTGPIVMEVPPGMLGAYNDAWFRYVEDIGPFGPDKGQGGAFLVIPPDYEGDLPSGYFNVRPRTYRVWVFMRGSIADGLQVAVKNIKENLKIYPLSQKDNPPPMEFINASGKSFNTIHDNDFNFYYHVDDVIQEEPLDMIDAETRGLLSSIGIRKGKVFDPDERMKRILTDAVAIGNATARSIVWYPRITGSVDNMHGIEVFPDENRAWLMGWVDKNVFFNGQDGKTMNSDARVMFHYPYTAVTPAMAVTIPGKGSDYAIAYIDENKLPFDGSKAYKIHVPVNPPAKDFWALTVYDTQTRSQLQTDQAFPTVGSQTEGLVQNEDGSYDIYFGPEAPQGYENNWLQTIPGKSWFVAFRLYGPLQPWIDKTWRPSEIFEVE